MPHDVVIARRTPESAAFTAGVERAMALTESINQLGYGDVDEIRSRFAELTGRAVHETFRLVPPFHTDHGRNIHVGERVFVNHGCTMYDLADITIGDDVLIGPQVMLLTSEHPVAPSKRRALLLGRPITVEDGVWIAAGATVIGGVTIGESSVVAAGSVVTHDVPAHTLVGGNPARVLRSIEGE